MKKTFSILLLIVSSFILIACNGKENPIDGTFNKTFYSMDTTIQLVIGENDPKLNNAQKVFDEIEDVFNKLHELTNNFESFSNVNNIYYINEHVGKKILIDPLLYDVLEKSLQIYDLTEGYFDISIGHIIDEWKYIINLPEKDKLNESELQAFIENVQSIPVVKNGIELTKENNQHFVKISEGVKIDLGAIAKGYAVNLAKEILDKYEVTMYQLKASDSSAYYGINDHKDRDYFRVGLLRPLSSNNADPFYGVVSIKNRALTTSGDSIQSVIYDTQKFHHIVSPVTKMPENFYSMITLLHDDAAFADAITTALMSMPKDVLEAFILEENLEIIIYNFDETIESFVSEAIFEER